MFTGITQGTFEVRETHMRGTVLTYTVELADTLTAGLAIGASVAIDGVCQTVIRVAGRLVTFEAIAETLARTTLGTLVPGCRVNVERSLRAGDEIGGHEVSGHVLCTGRIAEVDAAEGTHNLAIEVPQVFMRYILSKGFVAIDGCSLTVGAIDPQGRFWVHLIPETVRVTNLGNKRIGDQVNVEPDTRTVAIVETVERVLDARYASKQKQQA